MDRECSMQGSEEECIQGFGSRAKKKESNGEDTDGSGWILKWISEK
jgi:hypothetical protein